MITALWSMYRSKRIAEGQLRSAINSIDDGFALYDELDRLVFANEKYLSYYDLSRSAIYPCNTFENILREGLKNGQYKDAIGREDEWLQERLDKHFNPTEPIEQKLGDGRWLKVAETRSPDGNTVGFRVDITELKQARERAEAANRAKNNFLNIISHELRTPLTSVIGYARFLENLEVLPGFKALDHAVRSGADKSECAEALAALRNDVSGMSGRITTASDHLLGLINDVLDRAKLEAETVELNLERIDLKDTVKTVTSGLGIKATEKGISLTSDVAPLRSQPMPSVCASAYQRRRQRHQVHRNRRRSPVIGQRRHPSADHRARHRLWHTRRPAGPDLRSVRASRHLRYAAQFGHRTGPCDQPRTHRVARWRDFGRKRRGPRQYLYDHPSNPRANSYGTGRLTRADLPILPKLFLFPAQ